MYQSLKLALSAVILMTSVGFAQIAVLEFDSAQQEAQYQGLINEFRCPTCQNQNLAGSDAPIAQDLKQKTYQMVKDGRSDAEIRAFMLERYGDFISYKPPVRPSTWILWFFPPLLLLVLVGLWLLKNKKPKKLSNPSQALTKEEEARLSMLLKTHQHLTATDKQDSPTPKEHAK